MPKTKDEVLKQVGQILDRFPYTRNSDKDLCREYRKEYDNLAGSVDREQFEMLTPTSSIMRSRRWYNARPRMMYLATDPAVLRTRRQAKNEYATYYASISLLPA